MITTGTEMFIIYVIGLVMGTCLGIVIRDLFDKEDRVIIRRTIWLRPKEVK